MNSDPLRLSSNISSGCAGRWPYASYDEYLQYQHDRSKRSRGLTAKYAAHRSRLAKLVRECCPQVKTVLCLGARHPVEVESLSKEGFVAEGIDLFADAGIRRCDMSRLDEVPDFREREFDLFFSCFALEHCLDFERFCQHGLAKCRHAIAVAISVRTKPQTSAWNCVAFDFQRPDATAEDFEKVFVGFKLAFREIVDGVLRFVLAKKDSEVISAMNKPSAFLKNVMVANFIPDSHYSRRSLEVLLSAQIANSIEIGWKPVDILLVTNFSFSFMGVSSDTIRLDSYCPRGSKMFAIQHLLRSFSSENTVFWSHDLDCWQNIWFTSPAFADAGACEYSRPKFNGGSVFWRRSGMDIVDEVVRRLRDDQAPREEPTINAVFKEQRFRRRVTVLNPTYNVGCSGFKERLSRSEKPVRACHFRPTNRLAWATHVLNRHALEVRSASMRLERLLRDWYPGLPTELNSPTRAEKISRMSADRSS